MSPFPLWSVRTTWKFHPLWMKPLLNYQCWVGVSPVIISGPVQRKVGDEREAKPSALGPPLYLTFIKHIQHTTFLISYYCPHLTDDTTEALEGGTSHSYPGTWVSDPFHLGPGFSLPCLSF